MDNEGYNAKVVYNAQNNMYRVIVESFDTRSEAARARDAFKAKYPNRKDFQEHGCCIELINMADK